MAEVTINYKDAAIATMDASGTKTLQTQGKYCEDDIEVVYARPSAPSGTKQINITQNGTTLEDVAAYANAEITVNVQGGGEDRLSAFLQNRLESYFAKGVQSIFEHGLQYTGSNLKTIVLPDIQTLNSFVLTSGRLSTIDYGSALIKIPPTVASSQPVNLMILRSPTLVSIGSGANAIPTPFKNGGSGGTIYIPKALYDHLGDQSALDYKSATNWSTIDGYGTITWAQIEGSQYENAYADGTPIT